MPKSPSPRKRAPRTSSPTGENKILPIPAAHRAEPEPVEAGGVPAPMPARGEDRRPSSEAIALHAYHLWLGRGRPIGTAWDDWLEAERQLAASA